VSGGEVEALRAEVAELRERLEGTLRVIGIFYDAGWDDALGTPGTRTAAARTAAYRRGLEAGQPTPNRRRRHLRRVQ
jgi:hypothetical protein